MNDVSTASATSIPNQSKGLRAGAIGLAASVVAAVASVGPALAIAVVLGSIIAVAGVSTPGVVFLGVIPVLLALLAFRELNLAQPDCGTSFVWVGRSLGPSLGFLAGWGVLMACIVNIPASVYIGATYLLSLLGLDDLAGNKYAILALSLVFIAGLVVACYYGVEAAAWFQAVLVMVEVALVALLLGVAVFTVATGDVLSSGASFDLSWLNPFTLESPALIAGVVLVIFGFWGWDVSFALGEETRGRRTPARAALITIAILIVVYAGGAIVFLSYAGVDFLSLNAGVLMEALGESMLGAWASKLLVVCVIVSVLAVTQSTILAASRALLAMGAYRALPAPFARVNRFRSPGFTTIIVGVVAAAIMIGLALVSDSVLIDSLSASGLLVAFYYVLTSLACFWYFRKTILRSVRNLLVRGVAPLLAVGVMGFVLYQTVINTLDPASSSSQFLGVGMIFVLSFGTLLIGIVILLVLRLYSKEFFSGRTLRLGEAEVIPDLVSASVGASSPEGEKGARS